MLRLPGRPLSLPDEPTILPEDRDLIRRILVGEPATGEELHRDLYNARHYENWRRATLEVAREVFGDRSHRGDASPGEP